MSKHTPEDKKEILLSAHSDIINAQMLLASAECKLADVPGFAREVRRTQKTQYAILEIAMRFADRLDVLYPERVQEIEAFLSRLEGEAP